MTDIQVDEIATDPMAEYCPLCLRWHQKRERPVRCTEGRCTQLTDGYHALCPAHRVA